MATAEIEREAFFARTREAIRAFYLADPGNPYRMSGRTGGRARWQETRRCIADAVDRDGSFLDVGCANGLLLETLRGWVAERGTALEPHGIDFVPELVAAARARHPDFGGNFEVANAWHWRPGRRFDYVRTSLEYLPEADWPELVARTLERAVARRLIVCHYRSRGEPVVDVASRLAEWGYAVAGGAEADGVRVAWFQETA